MKQVILIIMSLLPLQKATCQETVTHTLVCPGDTVSLFAYSEHADVFDWYKDGEYLISTTGNNIEVTDLGEYSVTAYNYYGCKSDPSNAFIVARDTMFTRRDTATLHSTTYAIIPVVNNDKSGCYQFDRSSLKIISNPWHGKAEALKDGTVRYIPERGTSGVDQFFYTITDYEEKTSAPTLVTVWVGNECGLVYPNPTHDIVKVNTRNNDVRFLRLCDVSGRVLQVLPMQVGEKEMSVGAYPDGVYLLQLMNEAGNALCTYKVEKQYRY